MSEVRINWSTAEVADGKLSVELGPELPKGWKQSFNTTVRLLGGGDWGAVKVRKGRVEVDDVSPGTEEKLRHFLESAVTQVNSTRGERDSDGDEPSREETGGPDAEMASRFRGFADDASEDG